MEGPLVALSSVAWMGSKVVAVATGGAIVTSPDGESWTHRGPSDWFTKSTLLFDVIWTGSQLVAVGGVKDDVNSTRAGVVLTSPDGIISDRSSPRNHPIPPGSGLDG